MPNLRRRFIRGDVSIHNPKLLGQTDRFAQEFTRLFDADAWLGGKENEKTSSQREADAVVPVFINRYEELKEKLDLSSATSLGTEALDLHHQFAKTTYGPDLDKIERQIRSKFLDLLTAVWEAKFSEIAVDNQFADVKQLQEEMETHFFRGL